MFSRRFVLPSALLIAALAAGCSGAATPSSLPIESPSTAPTVAPVEPTPSASVEASATAETVLPFEEIDVEALSTALVDGGWFGSRIDDQLDSGEQQILLQSTKSGVVASIVHDGAGNLLRVSTYDPDRFSSDESLFDLGVMSGILLGETLGTELVLWHDSLRPADASANVIESRVFGPDAVTVAYGQEGSPDDGFVFFEPAE